jgi:hypothetical protein
MLYKNTKTVKNYCHKSQNIRFMTENNSVGGLVNPPFVHKTFKSSVYTD